MKILLAVTLSLFIAVRYSAAQELPLECKLTGIWSEVFSIDFSPDDKSLVVGSRDGTIQLFDVATQQIQATRKLKGDPICQVSFSHDGESIAVAASDKLILWDRNLNKELFSLPQPKIMCFAFNSTSDHMLIGSWNADLDIFDVKRKAIVKTIGHEVTTRSVAWSPNGKLIACGNWGDYVQVFDANSYEKILQLERYRKNFPPVAFSPDSSMLAVGGTGNREDRGSESEVLLWNLKQGKEHARLRAKNEGAIGDGPSQVCKVEYCPNGELLAATHFDQIRVWDLATKSVIANLKPISDPDHYEKLSLAFSHKSKYLAMSDGKEVKLWKLP